MSNNNAFWGKRYGYWEQARPKGQKDPFGMAFKVKSYGKVKMSNSGKASKNKGVSMSSKLARAAWAALSPDARYPVITYNWKGVRIS